MDETSKPSPVINIADIELQPRPAAFSAKGPAADTFDARMGSIAPRIGARLLGYNITAVPPGKRAFPSHNHMVNEEMFHILEGTGELLMGEATYAVKPVDIVACPPGGPEVAHQFVNTGQVDLKYLAVSTLLSPEVCQYPDSDKFAVSVAGEDPKPGQWRFRHVGRTQDAHDYWEGE